jgi:hypothetical protein
MTQVNSSTGSSAFHAVSSQLGSLWQRADSGGRALWVSGLVLLASGLLHLPAWALRGDEWVGPLSFRKPILFGIATGLTLLSLSWIVGHLALSTRRWRIAAWLAAGGALLEVGIISIQAWRQVPSHFNTSGAVNTILYVGMEMGVTLLSVFILAVFIRSFRGPCKSTSNGRPKRAHHWVLPWAMGYLCLGLIIGVAMAIDGHRAVSQGTTPGIIPPEGLWIFLHGMPLHAPQWLWPLLWLLPALGLSWRCQQRLLIGTTIGIGVQTLYAAMQVFSGHSRFDAAIPLLLVFAGASGLVIFPWLLSGLTAIRNLLQRRRILV